MTSSYVTPLLIFDLVLSFISEIFSLNYSSSSYSCSSPRFFAQASVSLGESSEPWVVSLVSPMSSHLFLNSGGFFLLNFSTSGILSSFALLLGLSRFWILSYSLIGVSEFLFIIFLRGLRCLSGVTLDKISPCLNIPKSLELSLLTSLFWGFSILVLFSDNLTDEIDLYLLTDFTVSSVSVIWLDLNLSHDLPLSDLLLMDLSFFISVACDFSVLLTMSIFFLVLEELWLPSPH